MFDQLLMNTTNKHAPIVKTRLKPKFIKGLSVKTKELKKEREKLRKIASKCTDPQAKKVYDKRYRDIRNKVKSSSRKEAKRNVYKRMKESNNPSEYWKNAKDIDSTGEVEKITLIEL